MIKNRYLIFIFLMLSLLLLFFGFYPLTNSANATTDQASSLTKNESKFQCAEVLKISKHNQASLKTLERLVSYLESSVKDIKMTANGIDRKLNTASQTPSKEKTT